jgi:hypothetical protein
VSVDRGNTEIDHYGALGGEAWICEDDVFWLEVQVDDAETMSLGEGFYKAVEEFVDALLGDRLAAGKKLAEAFAFDVFEDEKRQAGIGLAEVENSAKIEVTEAGQRVNFGADQVFDNLWIINLVEHFDYDQPIGEELV